MASRGALPPPAAFAKRVDRDGKRSRPTAVFHRPIRRRQRGLSGPAAPSRPGMLVFRPGLRRWSAPTRRRTRTPSQVAPIALSSRSRTPSTATSGRGASRRGPIGRTTARRRRQPGANEMPAAPAPGPVIGPGTLPSPGCAPPVAPSWLRKLSAVSRSFPRRSSRPANSSRKPGSLGAAIRSSTCSTTCTAAVPSEPRQQRPRQRIVVLDRPRRLAVRPPPRRGVRERQRLLALVVVVVEHRDLDRPRRLARLEGQQPGRGLHRRFGSAWSPPSRMIQFLSQPCGTRGSSSTVRQLGRRSRRGAAGRHGNDRRRGRGAGLARTRATAARSVRIGHRGPAQCPPPNHLRGDRPAFAHQGGSGHPSGHRGAGALGGRYRPLPRV